MNKESQPSSEPIKLHHKHRIHPCRDGYKCTDCKKKVGEMGSICEENKNRTCDCSYYRQLSSNCCDECAKSEFSLKGKQKDFFNGICGLSCKCHNLSSEESDVREKLSELEHEQWIAWSKNIAETEKITPERLELWQKLWRPYSELTEAEKDQDREWADKVLEIVSSSTQKAYEQGQKDFGLQLVDFLDDLDEGDKVFKKYGSDGLEGFCMALEEVRQIILKKMGI